MSGHSKWSTIKRKKAATDAKRGKVFSKLIREITVAARQGGGDADTNPRLRLAIDRAKAVNMPSENISRAIKKGTGELEGGSQLEEYCCEGYGPGKSAVLVEVVTDNRNRSTPEIRKIFDRCGGSLGKSGCVAWQFHKRGLIVVAANGIQEEALMETAIEAGAEDIREGEQEFEVITAVESFHTVKASLEAKQIPYTVAEITMIPQNTVKLAGKEAEQMLKMMEELEDHDDVQNVFANFDMDDSLLEARS